VSVAQIIDHHRLEAGATGATGFQPVEARGSRHRD
jgi:inorganic pyrophosphatase/exopolyphosphatase